MCVCVRTHIYMGFITLYMCVCVCMCTHIYMGFPGSSAGEEPTYNAGDPDSIPGSGRSAGEGLGYPLQYSWASLVVQLVKNLPAMQDTWVQSLDWKDPPEKRKSTHSSILAWRIPWTVQCMGLQRVGHDRATFIHNWEQGLQSLVQSEVKIRSILAHPCCLCVI